MAWDKYFMEGLQTGADLALKKREMKQQEQARQAFLNAMQGGGLGGDNPPLIKIPDPSSPIGVRLEVDPRWKAQIEVQKQTEAEEGKKSSEANRNFLVAKNKLKTTMAAFKAMANQEGAGRVGGFQRILTGATGQNPYVKAYEGQLVEAAAALAKLAAPSARVGQEIIQQFRKTLPTKFSTMDEAINQIRFSLHNAFSTALGQAGEDFTPEMKSMIDDMVSEIVAVEPMGLSSLDKFKKGEDVKYIKTGRNAQGQRVGMKSDGTIEVINGK